MATRDESRQAVLGLLAPHGAVQWHGRGQDVAFADEVLELAARLGRVETVPALRPLRVATEEERKARIAEVATRLGWAADATGSAGSDEQGAAGVPGSGRQGTTEGDGL